MQNPSTASSRARDEDRSRKIMVVLAESAGRGGGFPPSALVNTHKNTRESEKVSATVTQLAETLQPTLRNHPQNA